MEYLYNDIYYIVMMNLDQESLYHFCQSSTKICNNEAFWKEYMETQFIFYVPNNYTALNPIPIITGSWHHTFNQALKLNDLLQKYDNHNITLNTLKANIFDIVQHNDIDVLTMYLEDKVTDVTKIIVNAGVLYNNDIILNYLYDHRNLYILNDILAEYGTAGSYKYFNNKIILPSTFPFSVISFGNVALFKYLITVKEITQYMLDSAIIRGNVEIADIIINEYPRLNPNIGANYIYNNVSGKMFKFAKNRDKLLEMEAYLLKNHIYGDNSNAVLYAVKTGNIDMLEYFYKQGKIDISITKDSPIYNNPTTLTWFQNKGLI